MKGISHLRDAASQSNCPSGLHERTPVEKIGGGSGAKFSFLVYEFLDFWHNFSSRLESSMSIVGNDDLKKKDKCGIGDGVLLQLSLVSKECLGGSEPNEMTNDLGVISRLVQLAQCRSFEDKIAQTRSKSNQQVLFSHSQ